MYQIVPGGRQRASSVDYILDNEYEYYCDSDRSNSDFDNNITTTSNKDCKQIRPGRLVKQKKGFISELFTSNSNSNNIKKSALEEQKNCNFDSDDGLSSQTSGNFPKNSNKNKSRTVVKLSFKSVKKAVSRTFFAKDHKGSRHSHASHDNDNKVISQIIHSVTNPSDNNNYSSTTFAAEANFCNVWTPEIRQLRNNNIGLNADALPDEHFMSTMSSSRPLIMEPEIDMTIPKWKNVPGSIGIYNHGNNCFINTILQCLSNTDSFTEYFVRDYHKNDLKQNKKSVFRTSICGEVTEQLAYLLKSLWCGNYHGDISKEFKAIVGKYNDQYRGDHQHDAQEFLLWLLDRLHEDLCTVSKKKTKPSKVSEI